MDKIRKNQSIVMRTFLISFTAMMVMVTLMLGMQSLYINRFYMDRKIDNTITSLNTFAHSFQEEDWTVKQLLKEANKYNSLNNANLSINGSDIYMDEYAQEYMSEYMLTILVDDKYFEVFLTKEQIDSGFETMPYTNQTIDIEGTIYTDGTYESIILDKVNNKSVFIQGSFNIEPTGVDHFYDSTTTTDIPEDSPYESSSVDGDDSILYNQLESTAYVGKATIIDITDVMETIIFDGGYESEQVDDYSLISFYETEYDKKNDVYYKIQDTPYNSIKEVHFTKMMVTKDNKTIYLSAQASLQPVNEVVSVLRDFGYFFYIIAILISIFIAIVYSKLVSRPLITLTHVADRMAKMDFDVKSPIQRKDELGVLSNSLNILSSNLDTALGELHEANEQLILDMEKEKKQEQVRKEFVANVSHELKTPLGIIKGYAEGIKDGIKKEKSDYYIDVILDEIEKMNVLILDMLELSKIEAGKGKEEEVFQVINLIEKTVKLLEIPMEDKDLHMQIKGEFTTVKGVKFQIDQVIVNLLSNAVKYGEPKTDIKITGRIEEGYQYISVYNEGQQLSKEELESLWLRFYKIDKSHHRESGGTGLGLAIVKAILEGHGCDYGVKNHKKGLLFYFGLPVQREE